MTRSTLFLFGPYILDPKAGLFRDERRVSVPPKELALLHLLVQKHGRVVSYAEIEQSVWPRQTIAYTSIARCVYSLRKLLGSDGSRYIETVHKHGYRMAVAVTKFEPSSGTNAVTQAISSVPLAYSHYSAGMREANDSRPAAQERAVLLFAEAAKVDPGFAAAHAAVADTRMYQVIRGDLAPAEGLKLGLLACQRALERNPKLVQGLAVSAWFKGAMQGRFEEAHALLNEAQAIDSGYSRGFVYRSWIWRSQFRPQDSAIAAEQAMANDPHALLNRHSYCWALFCSGRVAEALELEQELRLKQPLDEISHGYAAIFAAYLGQHKTAIKAIKLSMEISVNSPSVVAAAAYVYAKAGLNKKALQLADLAAASSKPRAPRPMLAPAYLALGDTKRAVELWREGRDEGCAWFAPARLDPRLADLEMDDRFFAQSFPR